jgi:histidinol phosphatase-like PHP family hydrolase
MDMNKKFKIPRINLHNHTTFSDGGWSAFEVISKAIECELDMIGITDHFSSLKTSSIKREDLDGYISHIEDLKSNFEGLIQILIGIEVDSCPDRSPQLYELTHELIDRLDYVLFEYVNEKDWQGIDFEDFLEIRKDLNTKVGLAHWYSTDLLIRIDPGIIAQSIRENDIFIEITPSTRYNIDGVPFYRLEEEFFRIMADEGVFFSIGTDTHNDIETVGNIDLEIDFLKIIGAKNIVFSDRLYKKR